MTVTAATDEELSSGDSTTATRARPTVAKPRVSDPPSARFRPDIEGLRAVAVLAVVLYHYKLLGLSGGYVGVDVFFVISGFLITRQMFEKVVPGRQLSRVVMTFYAGRFRRLFPAAAVTIVVTVLVTKFYAPPLQQKPTFTDGLLASVYGINYRLAREGTQYLHIGDAASPLQHFWSLAVEEQFYVFLPAMLVVAFWCFRSHLRSGLLVILTAIFCLSLLECYSLTNSSQPWAYFSLHTRAWELAAGAIVAVSTSGRRGLPRVLSEALVVIGLAGIVLSIVTYTDRTVFPGIAAALPVIGAAFVLLGGVRSGLATGGALGCRPMRYLGQMSYSWYLWHWPMLILAPYVLGHSLGPVARVVLLLASFLVATQSYWVVEHPARLLPMRVGRWLMAGVAGATALALMAYAFTKTEPDVSGSGRAVAAVTIKGTGGAAQTAVSKALLTATALKEVPRNLSPTLDRAPNDMGQDHYNGCHADYTTVKQGACVYGDVHATRTAVLYGDSHMEQWFPGFDVAGQQSKWKVVNWTKSGCGFTDVPLYNASLNRPYSECAAWQHATVARIIALHPSVVILSGAEDLADGQASVAKWVAGSQATARKFVAAGMEVKFIEDSPRPTTFIPACVAANLTNVQRCAFTVQRSVIKPVRHAAIAAGMKAAGAAVVDPQRWLCVEGSCPVIVGNLLVYRDDNHLTATFSRWLAPVMKTLLSP